MLRLVFLFTTTALLVAATPTEGQDKAMYPLPSGERVAAKHAG
ncbi:hypothetical protein [Urbifossiella limnaea]|uniref:Uncharacterized protein n=1 Tax=Urbifossiella limnaea TaxID=2528023 RepID=A0A517XTF4_9BACT|nr:hypothetical protein [Urbifossiella limnaea]QDU20775.1 hypothetical protein ETAA1_27350 [Urbifossiella limnaea]